MINAPHYAKPPVAELVLGAQFSPLTKLTSGHFGLYWQSLGQEWIDPCDQPLLEDQFEVFDGPRWLQASQLQLRFEPVRFPGRFVITHQSKDRLIQLQATRFHLNWQKQIGSYPSYSNLISEFETMFARFESFACEAKLGAVAINQWELTYVDAFPQGDYWQTPSDWSAFLPGLFGALRSADGLILETHRAEWVYEIAPKIGRLHISAQMGRGADGQQPVLLLNTTARGPVGKGGVETLRAGLDLGHNAALEMFLRVTSDEAKKRWEQQL